MRRGSKWGIERAEYLSRPKEFARRGLGIHTARLDEQAVRDIRSRYGPATCKQLAKEYGVHYRTIEKVVSFETWAHVR